MEGVQVKQKAANEKLRRRLDALKSDGNPNISEYGDNKRVWVRVGNKIVCYRRPGSRQRH